MANAIIKITGTLTNCSCNYSNNEEYDIDKPIEITADAGFEFPTGNYKYRNQDFETVYFTNNVSKLFASPQQEDGNITLNGSYIATAKPVTGAIIKITGTLTNCSCNYSNNEEYDIDKPIEITADDGYEFIGTFKYRSINFETVFFNNSGSKLTASAENGNGDIVLNDYYVAITQVEELATFVNLYTPTNAELTELSKKRFITGAEGVTDFGQYITNLFILPFNLPNELKGDRTTIILGEFDTTVETTLLANYKYVVSLGEIFVEEKYNNVYDYINTDYILHIPFFNKIYLNSEYVVNQTISLEIVIDLYSGNATLNVRSSFTDEIVETMKNIIVSNVPFMQTNSNSVIGTLSAVDTFINQSFIEVVRNKPYTTSSVFGGETIEYGKICDYTEFIKCDNVVLNTNATNTEKNEIKTLLKNGVII